MNEHGILTTTTTTTLSHKSCLESGEKAHFEHEKTDTTDIYIYYRHCGESDMFVWVGTREGRMDSLCVSIDGISSELMVGTADTFCGRLTKVFDISLYVSMDAGLTEDCTLMRFIEKR